MDRKPMTTSRPTIPLQPDDLNILDRMLKKLVFYHDCGTAEFAAVARIKLLLAAPSKAPAACPHPSPTPASTAEAGEELATCPFNCGRGMKYDGYPQAIPRYMGKGFRLHCECGAIGPTAKTGPEAIAAWNRRAS